MLQTDQEYRELLTQLIKKQIIVLGPDITLIKAREVKGLTVSNDGTVTKIQGNPQELTKQLIDQFLSLFSPTAQKIIEPLLTNFPDLLKHVKQPSQKQPDNTPSPMPAPIPKKESAENTIQANIENTTKKTQN